MGIAHRIIDGVAHLAVQIPHGRVEELGGIAHLEDEFSKVSVGAVASRTSSSVWTVTIPLGGRAQRDVETVLGATIVRLAKRR